jgi:hypothetical protein
MAHETLILLMDAIVIHSTNVEPNIMHYDKGLGGFSNYCINCIVLLRNNNNWVSFW